MGRSPDIVLGAFVAALGSAVIAWSAPAAAADTFTLGFTGPDSLCARPGEVRSAEFTCTLAQVGTGPGAQGWSIGMTADGAAITAITTDGTDAAPVAEGGLQSGGFEKTELTTKAKAGSACEGRNGAVSSVVLSFTQPVTLDPATVSTLAKVTVEAQATELGVDAELRYADGCQGAGQPVENVVTQSGATARPVLGAKEIRCSPPPACSCTEQPLNLGFSAQRLTGPGDMSSVLGDRDGSGGEIRAQAMPGAPVRADAYVAIVSGGSDWSEGIQGWSLAVGASGDGSLLAATTDGTTAAVAPDGLRNGGFERTEVVDPAKEPTSGPLRGMGPQGQGAVSAVVLSFTQTITLRPNGVESVLRLTTELPPSAGGGEARTRLFFKDGLQGSGQPVSNTATVGGSTRFPCNRSCADVTIVAACCAQPRFVRGNANDDGRLDIADPIWIIQELFRLGPPAACEAAADANGDGMVDASDALYLIAYEFAAGPTPPPPFPECGIGSDGILPCTAAQSACW